MVDMFRERPDRERQFVAETPQDVLEKTATDNPALSWMLADAKERKEQTRNFHLLGVDPKNFASVINQVRHDRSGGVRVPIVSEWGDPKNPFGLGVAEAQARFILPKSVKGEVKDRLYNSLSKIADLATREFQLASLLAASQKLNESVVFDPSSGRELTHSEIEDWLNTIRTQSYNRLALEAFGIKTDRPEEKPTKPRTSVAFSEPNLIAQAIYAPVPTEVQDEYRKSKRSFVSPTLAACSLAIITTACATPTPTPIEVVLPTELPTQVSAGSPLEAPSTKPTETVLVVPETSSTQEPLRSNRNVLPPPSPEDSEPYVEDIPMPGAGVSFYDISGTTVEELISELTLKGPEDSAGFKGHAVTYWSIGWTIPGRDTNACDTSKATLSVNVTVLLPHWVQIDEATPELKTKWINYIKSLVEHEQGHVDLVVDNQQKLLSTLQSAATCEGADWAGNTLFSWIQSQQIEYDRKTDHGAAQGAVFP